MLDTLRTIISKQTNKQADGLAKFTRVARTQKILYSLCVLLHLLTLFFVSLTLIITGSFLAASRSLSSKSAITLLRLSRDLIMHAVSFACGILRLNYTRSSRIWANIRSESSIVDGYLSKLAVLALNSSLSWVVCFLQVSNILEGFTWRLFNACNKTGYKSPAVGGRSGNGVYFLRVLSGLMVFLTFSFCFAYFCPIN